jgi:catechol 2,3-dioxygenase-like lactoylglutathione lyase family enzyme
MIDHVSIGTRDLAQATRFYTTVLAPLGYAKLHEDATQSIFGANGHWSFCLYPATAPAALAGQRSHLAISAPSETAVHAFQEQALALGAQQLRAPGLRPDINAQYFGSMITDPDGHQIEVVHWRAAV